MIRDIETISKKQYPNFPRDVDRKNKHIQSPTKRNKTKQNSYYEFLATKRKLTTAKKLEGLKNDPSLFSHLHVTIHIRDEDEAIFLAIKANYIHSPI